MYVKTPKICVVSSLIRVSILYRGVSPDIEIHCPHVHVFTCFSFRDPELKMNNRMPFSKLKERFPNPLFSQLPCLGKGREGVMRAIIHLFAVYVFLLLYSPDLRDDLRVAYCEIRASSDANNNVLKTAEYLALNKWVRTLSIVLCTCTMYTLHVHIVG